MQHIIPWNFQHKIGNKVFTNCKFSCSCKSIFASTEHWRQFSIVLQYTTNHHHPYIDSTTILSDREGKAIDLGGCDVEQCLSCHVIHIHKESKDIVVGTEDGHHDSLTLRIDYFFHSLTLNIVQTASLSNFTNNHQRGTTCMHRKWGLTNHYHHDSLTLTIDHDIL